MKTHLPLLLAICLSSLVTFADDHQIKLEVAAVDEARENMPLSALVQVPAAHKDATLAELDDGGWAQLTAPGLLADAPAAKDGHVVRQIHFIVREQPAGKSLEITATISDDLDAKDRSPTWHEEEGKHITLKYSGENIIRYMCEPYDDSTPENRERTYKVFHHVYHPDGETLLTKGAGGRYTHHRGIYYGFSRCSYGDGKKADIWHCKGGVHQSHDKVLAQEAGPVVARHTLAINWHGDDKKIFAKEQRELTTYLTEGGLLIEFASKLQSVDGKLKLDGDPQHAGFQFRASNDVNEKTAGKTFYIRPSGKDKPGSFKQGEDQPWNAMCFTLGDDQFTVSYLDSPTNPKPAMYSERNYGRFGSYFVAETEGDETIDVNYRLWLDQGESTGEEIAAQGKNFTKPPKVTVK